MTLESKTGCAVERVDRGTGTMLRLRGVIDQTFDLLSFSQRNEGTTVLDLDKVTRITSFGVREWNKAIQLVSNGYLGFVNVRPSMVMQFNVVAGVSGNGQIVTMYVPFICTLCQTAFETLYDLRVDFEKLDTLEGEPPSCPDCAGASELDELPAVYFSFVNRQGPAKPPLDFNRILEGTDPSAGLVPQTAPISERVHQEIEGNETYLWLNGALDAGLGLRRLTDSLEGTVIAIMQGVTAVAPEASSHVSKLLNYNGGPLYFVRVPPSLEPVLTNSASPAAIGSWWLEQECPSCFNLAEVEVGGVGCFLPVCPKCQRTMAPDAALVSKLAPLPATVINTLAGRNGPRKAMRRGAFLSRFEVLRNIGVGGMGEVSLARMQGLGGFEKHVALKRILSGLAKTTNALEMFLSEARLAARLSHRNIVQIFDVGHENGEFYIAMEFVDGLDLRALFDLCKNSNQLIPPAIAMQVIADAAAGLGAAHSHVEPDGTKHVIVHRDVSPHNILISTAGEAKITDFGIAKMESDPEKTPTSVTKGKLSYLAPEQVRRDGSRLEPRSDLFSLGVVLFQTLTLQHPFAKAHAYGTLKAVLEDPVPPVSLYRENLPLIDAIIARATAKEVETRYPSAEAFRADLLAAIGSPPPDVAAWLRPLLSERPSPFSSPSSILSKQDTAVLIEEITAVRQPPK